MSYKLELWLLVLNQPTQPNPTQPTSQRLPSLHSPLSPNLGNSLESEIIHTCSQSQHQTQYNKSTGASVPSFSSPPSYRTLYISPLSTIHETMRGRWMDRFVILPFSVGCVSQSSVAVCENQQKGSQAEAAQATPSGGDGEEQPTGKHKNSYTTSVLLPLPRPNISEGLQKLVKSFKSISQYFVFHKEEDDDDDEDVEMEIGFPTDVQHVAHIGWDGFSSVGSKKSSWDKSHPDQLLPFPSFSLKQFELAMATQAGGPASHGPRGSWPQ